MKLIFVLIAIIIVIIPIKGSLAQPDARCLLKISNCLGNVTTQSDILGCCPIIKQEIDNEKECFCLLNKSVQQNQITISEVDTILILCSITQSFQTLCPAGSNEDDLAPLSSPPSSNLTPTETSSAPSSEGSCWDRLANCTSEKSSASDISECCPLLKEEISDERECFCAAKSVLLQHPSDADSISQFLTLCSVSSFDTLCPGTPSNDPSPSDADTPPGPPLSPRGSLFSSPLGKNDSRNGSGAKMLGKNSSNKFSNSLGLLPTSFLLIWAMF